MLAIPSVLTVALSFSYVFATAKANSNLLSNPSVEILDKSGALPRDWNQGNWGVNVASFSYNQPAESGNKSVSVTMSGYVDGDAKWFTNAIGVTPGAKYRYSDHYKATVDTEIMAEFTDANGALTYHYLGIMPASASWKKASVTVTAPDSAVTMNVYHVLRSVGSLTTDSYNLELVTNPVVLVRELVASTKTDAQGVIQDLQALESSPSVTSKSESAEITPTPQSTIRPTEVIASLQATLTTDTSAPQATIIKEKPDIKTPQPASIDLPLTDAGNQAIMSVGQFNNSSPRFDLYSLKYSKASISALLP